MMVNEQAKDTARPNLQTIGAFLAIYVIWGSTFLAIRLAVTTVPPLFAAGIRFFCAGAVVYLWSRTRGVPNPTKREWRNAFILSVCLFLIAYSGVFWAERRVASGLTSVLVAAIPVWTALFEVFLFKREALRPGLILALVCGVAGVITLVPLAGTEGVALLSVLAIVGANLSWALGTSLAKQLSLPSSKLMSAAAQMLIGGVLLLIVSALFGEWPPIPTIHLTAALAIAYLATAGSILAFTSYIWLLDRFPATTVSSYAYVNSVIALALGHWFANETFTLRTFFGTALVLGSVILLLAKPGTRARLRNAEEV